ncbi:MAG: carbamoyltransferase [Hyphomicrobium sp.]|nr:carbamoyltransferase [Hyphomicrobium sp.]PPC83491.1 MAG: carbamoyltransferase [Hyphomicrobium sp.]
MRILGIVGSTHDSGLAILDNGKPDLVLEEERLNRVKKTLAFPTRAITAALGQRAEGLASIDVMVMPWDQRALQASAFKALMAKFPSSLALLSPRAHTPQKNEVVLLDRVIRRKFKQNFGVDTLPPIVNVGHHNSHAAMYFVSPFDDATVLVMDGYGDDAATSIYVGNGAKLTRRWRSSFFNSIGMVYTLITEYLGFGGFSDEGKVMALAAFGDDTYVDRFRDCIRLHPDGTYAVNMDYFSYDRFGQLRPFKRKFYEAFGPARAAGTPLEDRHRAVAFALQKVTEETILHIVRHLTKTIGTRKLVLAGGVALNCVANARILELTDVETIWVPPCASDTGAPLGAALWHYHQTLGHDRGFELTHAFYGLEYSASEIEKAMAAAGIVAERLTETSLLSRVAADLADGKIVGWFQGRFEMGPRALGNRSILADPRKASMRDVINAKIKQRESFRPFAPAVLIERASEFFFIDQPDPFMTMAPCIRPEKAHLIPAAVHADGTGRIQTVARAANPRYYGIIEAFGKLTGVPVLLNTSFNRQEPIVSTPAEAISCFLRTGMDVLVMGDYYVSDRNPQAIDKAEAGFARV